MKNVVYSIVFIAVIAVISSYLYDSIMHLKTFQSPNGEFELVIKRKESLFTAKMPGDGGIDSICVEVILKDAKGNVIGTSDSNPNCEIFMGSIDVEWEIENNTVWYGRGKAINLKTGKTDC